MTSPILGIDLGTTNSLVAICDERGPRVLRDEDGHALVPSVVRFGPGGEVVTVGREALAHAVEFPQATVYSAKRLVGRSASEISEVAARLPYRVVPGPRGIAAIEIPTGTSTAIVTPQEVAAHVLARLKAIAERELQQGVSKAVITVPAYFDDAQRQATRDAARLAGLEAVRIVNEPTAASLAYGLGRSTKTRAAMERIAVYDFGGGTFDISILEISRDESFRDEQGEGSDFFQVLATAGDTALGGDDIDRAIIDLVMREIRAEFGASLDFPPSAQQALRKFAEGAKVALSERDSTTLEVSVGAARTYRRVLTRIDLEALASPFVERTLMSCRRAIADSGCNVETIDRVVLVGGSTRMPIVRREVERLFGKVPYTALNPDEVVALGAAVQAAIIGGDRRDLLLFDVLPLSLGIETVGGAVAKLLMRNATIPARAKEMFSTSVDGQTNVKVHVLQGERELVEHCRSLGRFDLRGIPPMPAGIPQIEVEFLVDQNGVLDVTAVERRSGRRASIQVIPSYGLTRDEVDRIEAESFRHAREDMHVHRVIDLRVNAALDVKWIETALARVRHDLPAATVAEVEARLAAVRAFLTAAERDVTSVDANAFHAAKEALDRASVPVHECAIAQSLRS